MTEIDVSDAAVEAALAVLESCGYEPSDNCTRAAIAAAVPHLLEQVGHLNTWNVTGWPRLSVDPCHHEDGTSVPVYRLRTQENADGQSL